MVFSSITFLFYFLPLFGVCYFLAPRSWRNPVLLAFSLVFYAWGEPFYVLLLVISIALNFSFGLWVERVRARHDLTPMILAVGANLALLGIFKYLGFLVSTFAGVGLIDAATAAAVPPIRLPLGISFFTFHAISYLVDVWRGPQRAERDPVALAVYIAMFPQLVAGPIVRYKTICKALHERSASSFDLRIGMERFIIGLAQKVILANSLAGIADPIFALKPDALTAGAAWLGALCYTGQIYFDFAGYSNMAIGLARILGLPFPENFNYPYISRSITEFWRRWHMSLSSWFRDYVYIPLGGNRAGAGRTYFNLFVVFFLCGLWHGAQWTFVVWGMYHGLLLVIERIGLSGALKKLPGLVQHGYAMIAVIFGWVLFRSDSFSGALTMLRAMTGFGSAAPAAPTLERYLTPAGVATMVAAAFASGPWLGRIAGRLGRALEGASRGPAGPYPLTALRTGFCAAILLVSAALLAVGTYNPFIYFRF